VAERGGYPRFCRVCAIATTLAACRGSSPDAAEVPVLAALAALASPETATGTGAAPTAPTATATATAMASATDTSTATAAEARRVDLALSHFASALVVEPPSDGRARPLVVVTHGAGGRAEPHCDRYAARVRGRAWVVCLRGKPIDALRPEPERGYFYPDHRALAGELAEAMAALGARYGARVDATRAIYAGYSQGATMGLLALHERGVPDAFAGVLFVDGGYADWSEPVARGLAARGLARIALVCGQERCAEAMRARARAVERGGVALRIDHARGAGHTDGGAVAELADGAFEWLVEGDARYLE
jgi:predicted esterase